MTTDPGIILVTGASGFVGRHLLPALVQAFPSARLVTPRINIRHAGEVEDAVRAIVPDVCNYPLGADTAWRARRLAIPHRVYAGLSSITPQRH